MSHMTVSDRIVTPSFQKLRDRLQESTGTENLREVGQLLL